ncbi:MAG: flagellar motor switch protein FliN [Phycisphaerae bacterium]|nr:flagellar motor switch protein FliN [Phycisphaerae bacterium]
MPTGGMDDAFGAEGFSQEEIDALLSNAGGEPAADPPRKEPPSEEASGGFSQSEIDALMNGGDSPEDGPEPAAEASTEPDERLDSMGRPFDAAAAEMQAAIEEERRAAAKAAPTASAAPPPLPPDARPPHLADLSGAASATSEEIKRVTMLSDVNLRVKVQLGKTRMLIEDVLQLGEGSVVELDKLAGDPVDVLVNDRLVARGEVLVLNDSFCVRISEVVSQDPHRVTV